MQQKFTVFFINWAVITIMLAAFTNLQAQTAIGGLVPDQSAMLDLQSTSKGVLFPRISNPANISNPATGLMIFNTGNNCLEINLGTPGAPNWQSIKCGFVCGAYIAPGVWKNFMCHNLGSANFSADPFTPSWEIIGGYWQWGVQVQAAPGPIGPDASQANDGIPSTWTPPGGPWNTTDAPDGSWTDSPNPMPNNPCPPGYRIPTEVQWQGIFNNTAENPQVFFGGSPWSVNSTNYGTGIFLGPSLFLPAAGYRFTNDGNPTGSLGDRGGYGSYWSSTLSNSTVGEASYLYFDEADIQIFSLRRTYANSVRCIEE
jgi:uncharacterized protein (TIGR02145 family)